MSLCPGSQGSWEGGPPFFPWSWGRMPGFCRNSLQQLRAAAGLLGARPWAPAYLSPVSRTPHSLPGRRCPCLPLDGQGDRGTKMGTECSSPNQRCVPALSPGHTASCLPLRRPLWTSALQEDKHQPQAPVRPGDSRVLSPGLSQGPVTTRLPAQCPLLGPDLGQSFPGTLSLNCHPPQLSVLAT